MKVPLNTARKFELLEGFVPRRLRLPLRYYGQLSLGALEPEMRFLDRLNNNQKIAIDIGANKGIYSYALTKYAKHVYCFEPIYELCEYIKLYKSSKITVVNSALSNTAGHTRLFIPQKKGKPVTTRASIVQANPGESRTIKLATLDSFKFENVGFIKIDVEGAEEKVLEGGINTITNNKPVLLIEFVFSDYNKSSCIKIFNSIKEWGYLPVVAAGNLMKPIDIKELYRDTFDCNIIFLPK